MRTRIRNPFTTVTTAGLLLPIDLLVRIADGDPDLNGLDPKKDYHLRVERLSEATSKAWNECQAAWKAFRRKFQALPASDTGTTVTRDEWLLPLFEELGYGRLQSKSKLVIDDKEYPVSHGWENHVPIHLISARYPLDRRTKGVAGAATRSPYSMMQELLNRSARHRWGFLSNGLKLFLLCDNLSLARAANVEFDLEAMMEGEVYADFQLLFLLCHRSRVELLEAERKSPAKEKKVAKPKGKKPKKLIEEESVVTEEGTESEEVPAESAPITECWLDRWSKQAEQTGVQAREKLRFGVENAIQALGAGFLETRGNNGLRDRLRTGALSKEDFYRQLLRLVYRLILTLVAEEKKTEDGSNLLHPPGTAAAVRERYARFYSIGRLRTLARSRRGTAHSDLYESLKVLFEQLRTGHDSLGIPALGSFLFSATSTTDLDSSRLSNEAILNCIRSLCVTKDESARGGGVDRLVDFGNVGAEELGSVYESLLELHPLIDTDAGPFTLSTAAGNERKTTGSYYTPASLINCLLDSALDPVVHEAINKTDRKEAEKALLNLKICDPACGSGHFLIAAAERMAKHLARLRTEDDEPSTLAIQHAKRDIIGRCIYGVDLNPMAVELCKVSLWMEALEPGKPLSFLDHCIRMGNSLLGATPELITAGLPDGAFTAIEGDDSRACAVLKKRNKAERKGLGPLFAQQDFETQLLLQQAAAQLVELPDDRPEDIRAKETAFRRHEDTEEYRHKRQLADAWCAAFVIRKYFREEGRESSVSGITQGHLNDLAAGQALPDGIASEVVLLSDKHRFFHLHLAFPEVFAKGGFDAVLGNPPWEKINIDAREWFASTRPDIAEAETSAKRQRMIDRLSEQDPELLRQFREHQRTSNAANHFYRTSGRFLLSSRGDINTYALFAELDSQIVNPDGRAGFIVPSGLAFDETTKLLFQDIVERGRLFSLFDFENRNGIFQGVHRSYRFSLITVGNVNANAERSIVFQFFIGDVTELQESGRRIMLCSDDIALLNPNTRTCPIFRSQRDAEITRSIYRRVPVFVRESPEQNNWNIDVYRMFHGSGDSRLFKPFDKTNSPERLYEAKCFHQFDHRYATFENAYRHVHESEKSRPEFSICTQHYFSKVGLPTTLQAKLQEWYLVYRVIGRATDERTIISSILPSGGVVYSANIISGVDGLTATSLLAMLNSFVVDYIARQSVGGANIQKFVMQQLPMLRPEDFSRECEWNGKARREWICQRVLELTYTSWDLNQFAVDCGYDGPPFYWNEERRFLLRCELDAAYFHFYGIPRDDIGYIMDTFPIVRRKDIAKHGDFRTKLVLLDIYDRMQLAITTGTPYQSLFAPAPAESGVADPPRR